jgi:hypothetical protein
MSAHCFTKSLQQDNGADSDAKQIWQDWLWRHCAFVDCGEHRALARRRRKPMSVIWSAKSAFA